MNERWWWRLGVRLIWITGILVWSLLTFLTAAVAFESGSRLLYACSAALTAFGGFVLYRSTRNPGPVYTRTLQLGLLVYAALFFSYWIAGAISKLSTFLRQK